MRPRRPATPSVPADPTGIGTVLVGVIGTAPAETAMRVALDWADACGAAVRVVCTGSARVADDVFLHDLVDRWSEKYPRVYVTTRICRTIDAAVTLTAATRSGSLLVLTGSTEPAVAAVIAAVTRRSRCPVVVPAEVSDGVVSVPT
jgi:nucleotide-binding universal stress UspA family protein